MSARGRKAVSQEELRRLMKEKQRAAERHRRVQSPFAKYTSAGRLTCALCGEHVKSEAVWQAHVLGRGHKERVGRLKEGQGQKRKIEEEEVEEEQGKRKRKEEEGKRKEEEGKRKRKEEEGKRKEDEGANKSAGLPAGFFQSKGAAGLGLLAGQYGDDDEEDEEEGKGAVKSANAGPKPTGAVAGLPADFFESAVPGGTSSETAGGEEEGEEGAKEEEKGAKLEPQLPEGFFDDPVRDARVRNVDTPREQMDREWEEFQKEMRLVNSASDAIVAEDDEEGRFERQIDEIDEQIECFRRVELLRAKQEAAQGRTAKQRAAAAEEEGREATEDEEEDEEELLHVLSRDWRAKGALA